MDCKFTETKPTDKGERQVACANCGFVVVTKTAVELIHRACSCDKPKEANGPPATTKL